MHTFTFQYIGDEQEGSEQWTLTAQAEGISDAYDSLLDQLETQTGLPVEDFQTSDLASYVLQAVSRPGERIMRRDFSTPEENYNLVYIAPSTES